MERLDWLGVCLFLILLLGMLTLLWAPQETVAVLW